MAVHYDPIAKNESFNTTEQTPRNIADVLAEELSAMITAIGGLNFINFEVVAELPTTGISTTTIYLVPSDNPQSDNTYDEYINLNGTVSGWEQIGSTDIDLSGYYTSAEVDDLLADKADVSDIPTVNDGTLTIKQNGVTKASFSANQSGNSTVDIETPVAEDIIVVDEFTSLTGGKVKSLQMELKPIQNLHGYDRPWAGGSRKNKCEQTVDKIKSLNTSGTWSGNAYTWNGITYTILTDDANNVIGYDVDGTATARGWLFISDTNLGNADAIYNGGHVNGYLYTSDNPNFAVGTYHCWYSSNQIKSYILVDVGLTKNHDKWYPMARLDTVDDPTFEPYSNICPISGHTEVDIDVSDGQATQETYVINLGGTYYWIEGDAVSGEWSVIGESVKGSSITWIDATAGGYQRFRSNATLANAESNEYTVDLLKCSKFDTNRNAIDALDANGICIYSKYIYVRSNTTTSLADFQTLIADADICYKYATPIPLDLDPQQILAIIGENHFSAPLEQQEIIEIIARNIAEFNEVIDDENISDKFTYSSEKIEDTYVNKDSVDVQTAIDSFETINGGLLSECQMELKPIQDLHGYSEPWVGGSKKNKLPLVLADIKADNVSGTWNGNVYSKDGIDFTILTDDADNVLGIKANGTATNQVGITITYNKPILAGSYILNGTASGSGWTTSWLNVNVNGTNYNDIGSSGSFTVSADTTMKAYCYVANGATISNKIFYPMVRLASVTDASFEPYENKCPISGHTQVKLNNGKNLIGLGTRLDGYAGTTYFETTLGAVGYYFATSDLPDVVTISDVGGNRAYISYYNEVPAYGVVYLSKDQSQQTVPKTFTVDKTAEYVHIQLSYGTTDVTNIQIEEGSTATPYVPYNGYQVIINLGGTYYWLRGDVVTGKWSVIGVGKDMTTISDWNIDTSAQRIYKVLSDIKPTSSGTDIPNLISNRFKAISVNNIYSYVQGVAVSTGSALQFHISGLTDRNDVTLAEVNQWFVDNPTFVVYELATPIPLDLTPQQIEILVGENHIDAPLNGQEIISVKYKEVFTWNEVQKYVEGFDHNSMFRGKCLGTSVTAEQYAEIANGTFRDMYIGDYWYINDIRWRIADFDYWLGTGDVACTTHHIVIVPDSYLSTYRFNATNDTTGGYLGSELYTTNMTYAKNHVNNAFGSAHVLSHRDFYSNAVADGHASAGTWVDSDVDLMSEQMVYGSNVCSYEGRLFEIGVDKSQLSLFRLKQSHARRQYSYWLRGIRNAERFAIAGSYGLPDSDSASVSYRIRPCFGLKG